MTLIEAKPVGRRAELAALALRVLAHPYIWVAFAAVVLVGANAALNGPGLSQSLGDTDDAVRLHTVRELLNGASFFDTTLPRIGAPDPLVSHWSRLIDVPLAAMIALFRPVLGQPGAEWLTRAIWPLFVFIGLCCVVARETWRQGGIWATGIALSMITIMPFAMVQFRPGRIDHHNVQIFCAVAGLLLLRRGLEVPQAGWLAGVVLGLGLSVGYESIALVVPMLAIAGAMYVASPAMGNGPVRAAVAAAVTLLGVLLATTPPAKLTSIACDALSLNLVVLSVCAAAGLWIVSVLRLPIAARLSVAGVSGGMGILLFAASEPACLAGPFGQVDPAIGPIWLDHVLETQTLFAFTAENSDAGLPACIVLLAGVAAQVVLLLRARTVAACFSTVALVLSVLLGVWQIKLTPYALWLSAVSIAVLVAHLRANPRTMPLALRGLMVLLLTITFADTALSPFLPARDAKASGTVSHLQGSCYRTDNVEKLSALEPGLFAANTDLGSYIAALTPHRVVGAPYHRIPKGILAMHAMFSGDADQARSIVKALGVNYIASCTSRHESEGKAAKGFRDRLLASERFTWLEDVTPDVVGMRVWRVLP